MKLKLTKEYLDALFTELKSSNSKNEKALPAVKKILLLNTEQIVVDTTKLAERMECLDDRIIQLARARLELPKMTSKKHEEIKNEIIKQVNACSTYNNEIVCAEDFIAPEFDNHGVPEMKEDIGKLISRVRNVKNVIENEKRKSVSVNCALRNNPIRSYFDLH